MGLTLFLAGCGGGGSPSGHDNSTPSSPTAPSNPSPSNAAIVQSIIDLTNAQRSQAGIPTLRVNANLNTAAQLQANQIAQLKVLQHEIPGAPYPTESDRLRAAGYVAADYGENLASDFPSAADAVANWMTTIGVSDNVLSTRFTEIGAGYATDSAGVPYYVAVFARPG